MSVMSLKEENTKDPWIALQSLKYNAINEDVTIKNYNGSGQVRLDYINGCVRLDLNGVHEFQFMENAQFLKRNCRHEIWSSREGVCLSVHQMKFLEANNFTIRGIEHCSADKSFAIGTVLEHDLFIFGYSGGEDLTAFENITIIKKRLVCVDSILENLKFLRNVKKINVDKVQDEFSIEMVNCAVLEPFPFLPNIERIYSFSEKFRKESKLIKFVGNSFYLDNETVARLKKVSIAEHDQPLFVIEENPNIQPLKTQRLFGINIVAALLPVLIAGFVYFAQLILLKPPTEEHFMRNPKFLRSYVDYREVEEKRTKLVKEYERVLVEQAVINVYSRVVGLWDNFNDPKPVKPPDDEDEETKQRKAEASQMEQPTGNKATASQMGKPTGNKATASQMGKPAGNPPVAAGGGQKQTEQKK